MHLHKGYSAKRTIGKNKAPMKFPENACASLSGLEVGAGRFVCLCLPVNGKSDESKMQPGWNLKDYSGPRGLRSSLSILCLFSLKSGRAWLSHYPGMLDLNEI